MLERLFRMQLEHDYLLKVSDDAVTQRCQILKEMEKLKQELLDKPE
jgi:hypothetical protein